MDTKIYVMAPTEIEPIFDPMYQIVLTEMDAQEDEFNGYLRGMYDIWQNSTAEIIGICDWKNFFIQDNYILNKEYIEKTLQKYPIIISKRQIQDRKSVFFQLFSNKVYQEELEQIHHILENKEKTYAPAFDFVVENQLDAGRMMWITTKKIYDNYCSWLFSILLELKKWININDRNILGLEQLVQILFLTWLYMQPEYVREESVKQIETKDFGNADKKVEMKKRIVELKLDSLIQLYEHDIFPQSLVPDLYCEDDFGGKIPVWVCWWQGEEQMPPLVKMCYKSIKRNLPNERTELRLITLENCQKYVTLSNNIISKFNEGKITYTQLSDILRAELLFRYGGMWLDATYYVPGPFDVNLFERNSIFTIKFEHPLWRSDVTKGRWSGNFWIVPKGHRLFQFLIDSFLYYWEMEDSLVDYYLIDDIIAIAYERIPGIRKELDQCECSTDNVFELIKMLNETVTDNRIHKIKMDAPFYKLNNKTKYETITLIGQKTVYGYLMEQEEAD